MRPGNIREQGCEGGCQEKGEPGSKGALYQESLSRNYLPSSPSRQAQWSPPSLPTRRTPCRRHHLSINPSEEHAAGPFGLWPAI